MDDSHLLVHLLHTGEVPVSEEVVATVEPDPYGCRRLRVTER
ncbi:hypothetical protein [Actinokineospora sp.]